MNALVIVWVVLGVATLGLALYRKYLAMHEDTYVHISEGEARYRGPQVAGFHRIGLVDRWGVTLTIVTAALGIVLALVYLYEALPYKPF